MAQITFYIFRESLNHSLPSVKTIRSWIMKVDGSCGYSKPALDFLSQIVDSAKKQGKKVCAILNLSLILIVCFITKST